MTKFRLILVFSFVVFLKPAVNAADIAVSEECSLADAIVASNRDAPFRGCPGGNGADIITLSGNITLDATLPAINSNITIDGRGFTINGRRKFRIFNVKSGESTIRNIDLAYGNGDEGGGAIAILADAKVTIQNSLIQDNWAENGGAIWNDGTLSVFSSTIANNKSHYGGGAIYVPGGSSVYKGRVYISDSALIANTAGCKAPSDCRNSHASGGAIVVGSFSQGLWINDSTFGQNQALNSGGAIWIATSENFRISNSTFWGNKAKDIGGIYQYDAIGRDTIVNSIIAGNIGGDCAGMREGMINNLIEDGSCFGDITGDPLLGALFEPEDGSPAYYPILEGSPAIDAASGEFCTETDQIGTARPQGGGCDIGAIEFVETSG